MFRRIKIKQDELDRIETKLRMLKSELESVGEVVGMLYKFSLEHSKEIEKLKELIKQKEYRRHYHETTN
jgi:prefoldin subunit 5